MKKAKPLLVILILLIIIVALYGISYLINKVPENPAGTVGNTAGNLNNSGLFCEDEGLVYFSNPYDMNTLYSMNPDETNVTKLTNVGVQSINAAGNYLYYYQRNIGEGSGFGYLLANTGMYRFTKKRQNTLCLTRDLVGTLALVDSDIYYEHFPANGPNTVDRISIDKESEATIFPRIISPTCVKDSLIYFPNPESGHYLYTYDTRTGVISQFWDHPVWNPIYHDDGYIYFMDMVTDYELHRYNPATGEEQVLTTDRVDTYNVYGDYIYYQKNSQTEPALKRMRTDGSGAEIVAYGNYSDINITSQYVYFTEFNKPETMYHQLLAGDVNVSIFSPAADS